MLFRSGNYYIYGVYEVGGRDDTETDYVASYDVVYTYAPAGEITGFAPGVAYYTLNADGSYTRVPSDAQFSSDTTYYVSTGEKTRVINTSQYNADGSINLTAAKDLEGKEQKGRSWRTDDEFAIRLIPVTVTVDNNGTPNNPNDDKLVLNSTLADTAQPMP